MYQNINEQFTATARQFADAAAQVNRLALSSAEKAIGLQLSTLEQNTNAAFAFWGELAEVRDVDGLKAVWPKGVQTARESIERSVSASQEAFGQVVATNEAIARIAKGQVEAAQAQAEEAVETATKAAAGKSRS
ncbi:phasin family protein [Luteimonas granuli]|uniref:Phasin family protein n=1 Tax=Luteimonas granuli TaxID=1176533 RepID=A0A518N3D4_9GAMM|nr:phasin family protein [Luteimonas granuli]QDW66451.1 phasin family protein [Luteimonas granuli]